MDIWGGGTEVALSFLNDDVYYNIHIHAAFVKRLHECVIWTQDLNNRASYEWTILLYCYEGY